MKLKTSLTASRDGSIVDATDENLIHDAAAAHALLMAMAEFNHAGHPQYQNPIYAAMCRADELMAQWGFEGGEVE